jgi:hemerythrin-like domain-containing protein
MTPTEELKNEHEAVLEAVRILEAVCNRVYAGEKPAVAHFERLMEFLKVFVDRCHHGKEEDLLFPAMIEAGFSRDSGPIPVMLAEHQTGRGHVRAMGQALQALKAGRLEEWDGFNGNAREYIDLLRQHIIKEDNILYPMADARIPRVKQEEMLKGFEKIEEERIGAGKHEAFHAMLKELGGEYR